MIVTVTMMHDDPDTDIKHQTPNTLPLTLTLCPSTPTPTPTPLNPTPRPPLLRTTNPNSRFIALGELATGSAVPKDKTKKWVHALNLEPIAFMKKDDLSKRSADTTECPYVARKVLGGAGGGGRGGGGVGGGPQVRVCVCVVRVCVRVCVLLLLCRFLMCMGVCILCFARIFMYIYFCTVLIVWVS